LDLTNRRDNVTDRELLDAILAKIAENEAALATIESKLDAFVAEYKSLLYGFARDKENAPE
jgi:hypothetical protein